MGKKAKSKTCLHLVVRSSAELVQRCGAFSKEGDAVLFVDDGVMWLAAANIGEEPPFACSSMFLAADLQARGLLAVAHDLQVRVVTDQEFPDLLRKHATCLTWK
ncbi:MAG: hypothetical protein OET46_04110 [Xanthomonadales bacterium]|jgi:sulfur relay protein TusB/DsrH|nr:hypothetical protein [Xanthomonadales bacterium]